MWCMNIDGAARRINGISSDCRVQTCVQARMPSLQAQAITQGRVVPSVYSYPSVGAPVGVATWEHCCTLGTCSFATTAITFAWGMARQPLRRAVA